MSEKSIYHSGLRGHSIVFSASQRVWFIKIGIDRAWTSGRTLVSGHPRLQLVFPSFLASTRGPTWL
jgi:hypothetical protein